MQNRTKVVRFIITMVAIFIVGYLLGTLTPSFKPVNNTANIQTVEFEQTDEMNKLQEYLIDNTKNTSKTSITLPSWHMKVLRTYIQTHDISGGLSSVEDCGFIGVQFWVYDKLTIWLYDDDTMSISIEDMSFDLLT